MKITILKKISTPLILLLTFTFFACEKDLVEINQNTNQTKLGSTEDCTFKGLENNGKWLVFKDKRYYDNVANELRQRMNKRTAKGAEVYLSGSRSKEVLQNDSKEEDTRDQRDPRDLSGTDLSSNEKDEYGITYDPQPELALFEACAKHSSYRKERELLEDAQLRRGTDPQRIAETSINPLNVTSPIIGALMSKDGVIQIGSDIFVALNRTKRVKIKNNRTDIVNRLIEKGNTDILYDQKNIKDVEIQNEAQGSSSVAGFICTANFTALQGAVNQTDKSATYIFQWNDGDGSGAIDLEVNWLFGDGTSVSNNSTLVSKTYENLAPNPAVNEFLVCCEVSYTYLNDDEVLENCFTSSCDNIEVTLEPVPDPCDNVTEAMALLNVAGLDNVLDFSTAAGGAEVCIGLGPIAGAIANLSGITYEWTINDEEITGTNPCFSIACDGNYPGALTIKKDGVACYTNTFNYEHSGGDASCQGSNDIKKKDTIEWTSDNDKKTKYRAKHQTKKDNGLFNWGGNQVEGEITSYKKRNWIGWKKESRDHEIHMNGNVYPMEDGCACGGAPDGLPGLVASENAKNTYREELMFVDSEGIYCKVNDPYTVSFVDTNESKTYSFPQ